MAFNLFDIFVVEWICYNNPCLRAPGIDANVVCSPITPVKGMYYSIGNSEIKMI